MVKLHWTVFDFFFFNNDYYSVVMNIKEKWNDGLHLFPAYFEL